MGLQDLEVVKKALHTKNIQDYIQLSDKKISLIVLISASVRELGRA